MGRSKWLGMSDKGHWRQTLHSLVGSPSTRYGHAGISHPFGLLSLSFLPSHLISNQDFSSKFAFPSCPQWSSSLQTLAPPLPLGILPLAVACISPLTKTPDSYSSANYRFCGLPGNPSQQVALSILAMLFSRVTSRCPEMTYQLMTEALHLH